MFVVVLMGRCAGRDGFAFPFCHCGESSSLPFESLLKKGIRAGRWSDGGSGVDGPRITECVEETYNVYLKKLIGEHIPFYLFINKQEFEN